MAVFKKGPNDMLSGKAESVIDGSWKENVCDNIAVSYSNITKS
jgi:hypothetical protein